MNPIVKMSKASTSAPVWFDNVGYSCFLNAQSDSQLIVAAVEKIIVSQIENLAQSHHCILVQLKRSVRENMCYMNSSVDKSTTNEQSSMTIERVALSAHQRDPLILAPLKQPVDSTCEQWRCSQSVVLNLTVQIALRII